MIQENFTCSIIVNGNPDRAMQGIKNVAGWWATNVEGIAGKVNDVFTVRFGKTFSKMEVIEELPAKKMTWLVLDSQVPLFKNISQWIGTSLCWELEENKGGTKIRFTHKGLTPDTECYADCRTGWTFFITDSLFKLLTLGKGLPGTGIFGHILMDGRKYEGLIFYKNDPQPEIPEGSIFIDIKETVGEKVIAAHEVSRFSKSLIDTKKIKGEYYMFVENKPVDDRIDPFLDIQQSIG